MNQNTIENSLAHPEIPPSHLSIQSIVLIGLWSGLVTGIVEVLIQMTRKFGLHTIIGLGLDFVWMTPLADALLFLAVGLLFIPYSRRFPRLANFKSLVFVFSFLGAFSAVSYLPIEWYARDVLSLGIAVLGLNSVLRLGDGFYRLVRKTSPALVVVVILSGIGLRAYLWNMERQALADLPAANPNLPNVLLIVMDTVRAENTSLYGYGRDTTPVLRELSQQGVVFEQAFSTAPWTTPSHASLFTGRWPHELTADWEVPLDDTFPTLAEFLQAQGYETAGFVGNNYMLTYEYGLDRGFIHFEDYDASAGQFLVSTSLGRALGCWRQLGPGCNFRRLIGAHQELGRKNNQAVNTAALNWLSNRRKAPYFVFINYYDAHSPYLPAEPFDTSFDPRRPPRSKAYQTGVLWDGTPEETRLEKNNYDESIRWVDYEFGQLLAQLRLQGWLENTLVIVTSDHGEEFQEHQVMGHGDSLYRQSVQVPLLMIFPNHLPAGIRVDQPVSLRNIPATILDLAGLPDSSPFPGDTLTYYLDHSGFLPAQRHEYLLSEVSAGQWRPGFYPSSRGSLKSIEFDGLRYIRSEDGSEELYDFVHDPQELNDLSATPAGQAALPEYRTMLENILSSSNGE